MGAEAFGEFEPDDELVETVMHLVEFPTVVCGSFKREYLELPREVIITPMRKHQRYFPVVDAAGNLLPHFVAISNMRTKDMELRLMGPPAEDGPAAWVPAAHHRF